jgi:hypothetical protein
MFPVLKLNLSDHKFKDDHVVVVGVTRWMIMEDMYICQQGIEKFIP